MKRSILLPTIVMLAFIGCTNERIDKDRMVRNTYKSLEDCKKDYKEEFCEKQDEKEWDDDEETTYTTTYYHGPMYPYWLYERQLVYYGGYPRAIGITTGQGSSRVFYPASAFSTTGASAPSGTSTVVGGSSAASAVSGRSAPSVSISRGGFGSIGAGVAS